MGSEKPEVKTMTQGVTYRAGGLGFDETVGLAGAAGGWVHDVCPAASRRA